MRKRELVARVARRAGMSRQDVSRVLDSFGEVLADSLLRGESVSLRPVGTLRRRYRPGRRFRDIATGKLDHLEGRYYAEFRLSEAMRDRMLEVTPRVRPEYVEGYAGPRGIDRRAVKL